MNCPECGSSDTDGVYAAFVEGVSDASYERQVICNDCPTEWREEYGNPFVDDVVVHEELGE